METKAKELHQLCKRKTAKKLCKVIIIPIVLILLIQLSFIVFFICKKDVLGVCVFGGSIAIVLISFIIIITLFSKIPFKETRIDDMDIGVFVEPNVGLSKNLVIIHLVVGNNEYLKAVNLEYYYHATSNSFMGLALNISELVRYFNDYKRDKKKNLHLAILTKKIKDKSISAIYNKYSRKIAIVVDAKLCD